ncbi:MAG: DUF4203 domain-containing protein, partial [Bacillota bacterium]
MDTLAILVLIGYALVGVALCFFGSRWAKVIVAIYGFAGGFLLAQALLPLILTSLSSTLILFISLGAGVIVALLFVLLFYVGIFFVGFGAGVALSLLIIQLFSLNPYAWYVYVPALIVCCILGSLTLNNRRIFLSIFTAYIGASMLAVVIDQLFHLADGVTMPALSLNDPTMLTQQTSTVYLIALAVLFVAGLVIQLAVTS